ncbi:hypothetical protein Barb6_00767 [Bacteroidales bacterium Barb6]|nr:hypothetical protein Barb4_00720 [Bacteroidales bacterium Barb4]OAV72865.1 hypothetical protein Barb6_00767 [Bacteroidales bacterium Barb6]
MNYINAERPDEYLRSVRRELSRDGQKVKTVKLSEGKLTVDANCQT